MSKLAGMIPDVERRWFWWKPQWFYSWPVKIVRGEDEYCWRTLGIVTWAGSLFVRTNRCRNPECEASAREYWASPR